MPRRLKAPLPGKRYPLNMRTTKELRDKIEAAAWASGRSLVQEVEYRLEQSFARTETEGLVKAAATFAADEAVKKESREWVRRIAESLRRPRSDKADELIKSFYEAMMQNLADEEKEKK
jgi:hypothetical protein